MTAKLGALVVRAAGKLGASLDAASEAALATWLARLSEWNARMDLTAARSPEELVDVMLADALVLAPRLPGPGARVVDVGAGAGAPGLALAILRPDLRFTLVEPKEKRTSFLRTVIGEIGRSDVRVQRARGESLAAAGWDVALSRATLPPPAWLALGERLVIPGGAVWVLLATESPPTSRHTTLAAEVAYAWPLTGASRRALAYRAAFLAHPPRP